MTATRLTIAVAWLVAVAATSAPLIAADAPPAPAPSPGQTWVPGYWEWNGSQYAWRPGHWDGASAPVLAAQPPSAPPPVAAPPPPPPVPPTATAAPAPPPIPQPTGPGQQWIPSHWDLGPNGWYYVLGHYEAPPALPQPAPVPIPVPAAPAAPPDHR